MSVQQLFKALRARKHEIIIKNGATYASIHGQELKVCFREKTKRVIVPGEFYNRTEYHPDNNLYFKYDGYPVKEWKDGKKRLEFFLPDILSKLEMASAEKTASQEKYRKYFEELESKEQAEKDAQQLQENELKKFKELLVAAERWQKTIYLRNYINAMEKTMAGSEVTEEQKQWLEWSRKKADWYDPMIESEDDLLKDVDRDNLSCSKLYNGYK